LNSFGRLRKLFGVGREGVNAATLFPNDFAEEGWFRRMNYLANVQAI